MRGKRILRPENPMTAALAVLAVLMQTMLAVPVSVRMLHAAPICGAAPTHLDALPGLAEAAPTTERAARPESRLAHRFCPFCCAAAFSILSLARANMPAPSVLASSFSPGWRVAAWPPAHAPFYQSRAPPTLA